MILPRDLSELASLARQLPDVAFAANGIVHPRISLFAATYRAEDVTPVREAVEAIDHDQDFRSAVRRADADLRVYELALDQPRTELSDTEAARTIAYGMTAIEPGPDLFALGGIGDGRRVRQNVEAVLGGSDRENAIVREAGRAGCAILGALMAARMAGLPVIVDGGHATAALHLLYSLHPGAIGHCAMLDDNVNAPLYAARGVTVLPCSDPRPLFSLAAAILPCRAVTISGGIS